MTPEQGAPEAGAWKTGLSISRLQAAHVERQDEWCPDQKPDLSFRGNEMAGETGEACNVIKKLERERHGWRGSRATKQQLAEELADVVHTAILCAITAGIDLEPAVVEKFNSTSEKNGLTSRIHSALVPSSPSLLEEVGGALRKAAKPFVEFSELSGFDRMPADMPISAGSRMAARQLTAGDLRSLIEVLAKLGASS